MGRLRKWLIVPGLVGVVGTTAAAITNFNFGLFRDHQLDAHSVQLFGIVEPVGAFSAASVDAVTADADPTSLVTLANGLSARVVTANANAGADIDMMALWPNDQNPTYLIACNEQDTTDLGLQRIRLLDGQVETILTGTDSCDPVCDVRLGARLSRARRPIPAG